MRAVVQRVHEARVEVGFDTIGAIKRGLVVFLGVGKEDSVFDSAYLAAKIAGLRIFEDSAGLMNRSVQDEGCSLLCISQFTLFGDCRKGRRPGFSTAAPPEQAETLYEDFCERMRQSGVNVATGRFQSTMRILVVNDGPVTILLDSKKLF
ncbi:MAG TPA: D-aminoacyl-tRNA deacylase [Candidatus Limnocylindrales bacterium]|nr:D-aminoacyl-tRNA deacylase [Candidatus Limnocylindrales bacterium]